MGKVQKPCTKCNINLGAISYYKKDGSPYFKNVCDKCNYQDNKERFLSYAKVSHAKRDADPIRRAVFLMKQASKRGKDWSLSYDEYMTFWNKECFYCGCEVQGLHLDRINSNIGYQLNNVVSACGTCNLMKYTLSQEEFLKKLKQILLNLGEV